MGVDETEYPSDKPELEYVTTAIRVFLEETGKKGSFTLKTKSDVKGGFGSSGAVTVATLGALHHWVSDRLT